MTDTNGASGAAPSRTVELGSRRVTVERVSGRKASRAMAELRIIGRAIPELVIEAGKFRSEYEAANVIVLDRARAELEYGPRVLTDDDGEPRTYPAGHEKAGELVMYPGPLGHMTEEAWQACGQKLELPRSPSTAEVIAAVFPAALDVAEEAVYRLLALFAMTNADVKQYRRSGTLTEELNELADELLDDADADELLELAVIAGEVVEDQFVSKAQALGGRAGNALRLLGLDPATLRAQTSPEGPQTTDSEDGQTSTTTDSPSTSSPSSSRPTLPTDSLEPLSGTPTPSSTPPSSSSPASLVGSTSSGPE